MPIKLLLVGCGGHAKVVVDAVVASSKDTNIHLADDNVDIIGQMLFGKYPIIPIELGMENHKNIHISIGNNNSRKRQYLRMHEKGKQLITIAHPSAYLALESQIGEGCFIAANAIISSEAIVGRGCIINHAAIVDHDCKIDDFSHIAPSATLGGEVVIGENCLIGAGAIVLPGINIGDNVIVGAGSVVTKNIKANQSVVGIPARYVDK